MTNVQERAVRGTALGTAASQQPRSGTAAGTPGAAMLRSADGIRRLSPQSLNMAQDLLTLPPSIIGGGFGGGMTSIIQQLLNMIRQLLSALGMGGQPQSDEQYFQSADGSSVGDPHLSFNGTNGLGGNESTHFDSMSGHTDLLDSDSFAGGYQISTSVTQPGANGVTYNQQATISTDFGNTQVSLDKNGNATIAQNGHTISLANGRSYNLGNGELVTRNANGSVCVTDDNGMGGTITTTLSANGHGVNVNAQAQNVDLGGDLLGQPQSHHHHHHVQPIRYDEQPFPAFL